MLERQQVGALDEAQEERHVRRVERGNVALEARVDGGQRAEERAHAHVADVRVLRGGREAERVDHAKLRQPHGLRARL